MLAATTIYLTPYRSREQIVSGALTFAIVAGCPTVSTPYFYAEDLLASGAGVLVPFDDPAALADAVTGLLDDPERLARTRAEARAVGARAGLAAGRPADRGRPARGGRARPAAASPHHPPPATLPRARASHLLTMVDDVGIVQHADGIVPLRASGYCTDDIARLAIVALGLGRTTGAEAYHRMLARSLGFLRHAWSAERARHAQLHVLRPPLAGRAARRRPSRTRRLGARRGGRGRARPRAARAQPDPAARDAAGARRAALAADDGVRRARARPRRPRAWSATDATRSCARSPAGSPTCSAPTRRRTGTGPRTSSTYDNARLPQALIAAGARLGDADMLAKGSARSTGTPASSASTAPWLQLVGHRGRRRGEPPAGQRRRAAARRRRARRGRGRGVRRHRRGARARATRCARSSGSWDATGSSARSTTSPPAAATTASARRTSTATRAPSRRSPTSRRCSSSTPPASRRRCPNEARAARADRLAHAAAPLRAVGARDRAPGRRPGPARRGRDALRHAGLDHARPARRRLRTPLRGGRRRSTGGCGRRSTSPTR